MRTHSIEFKEYLQTLGRMQELIISFTYGGTEFELGVEDINRVQLSVEGDLLKSVMRSLEIDTNIVIPKGTEINVQYGLYIESQENASLGNEITEYINLGNFIVEEVTKQEDTLSFKIKCYDKMLYSMKDYEDLGIEYPVNLRAYIQAICTKLGITFANSSDTFANYDRIIPYELYLSSEDGESLGFTYRDVLDEIAQATGSLICINEDDELEIRYPTETNDLIDEEFLNDTNINIGEKYGPINSIVLSRGDADNIYIRDEESVDENGLCELKIVDNQIMNRDDRSDYLEDLLERLDGLEYYIVDLNTKGICYYDLGDLFTLERDNINYKCLLLNDTIKISQGLEEDIFNELPDTSVTDYEKADKTDRKLNRAVFMVDKANLQIQSIVQEIGDRSDKTTTITQDIDGIQAIVSNVQVVFDEITKSGEIQTQVASEHPVYSLEIRGNSEIHNYLYAGDEYTDNNVYVGG